MTAQSCRDRVKVERGDTAVEMLKIERRWHLGWEFFHELEQSKGVQGMLRH